MKEDNDGTQDDETSKSIRRPLHLGALTLSNSKRSMNHVTMSTTHFKTNSQFYQDTDSLHIGKKHWVIFREADYVAEESGRAKMIRVMRVYNIFSTQT